MAKHKQFFIRNLLKNLLFLFNHHKQLTKLNVLVFSIPRSGSTWLMELVWSQPSFKAINEPLNIKGSWLQQKSGINGFRELYTPQAKEKVVSYFKAIADGKAYFLNPNPLRKHSRFYTSRIVYKVIHGGELLINDIAQNTNSKVVYLIRHPIAVSLSRKQIPRTKELTSDFVLSRFTIEEADYAKQLMRKGNDMEKLILMWCIQNKLALQQRTPEWLVLSYESLTHQPENLLKQLAEHCDLPDLDVMLENVSKPSAVTTQSEQDSVSLMKNTSEQRKALISKWRQKVTEEEIQRYFEICNKMNFNIYNADSDFPVSDFIL